MAAPSSDGQTIDDLGYGEADPRTFLLEFLMWAATKPAHNRLMRADLTDHTAVPLDLGGMVLLISEYYRVRLHPSAGTVFDAIQKAKYPPKDAWQKALDAARDKRARAETTETTDAPEKE